MKKDYYKILGINKTASQDTIKRAYYTLSKKYHPDILHKETKKYQDIREAYEILKDPLKRKRYDEGIIEEDDIFTEESTQDTFTVNPKYYENPTHEPVVNILDSFWDYKFENAIKAIWNRNIFVLLGNSILIFILVFGTLINRIAKLFKKTILNNEKPNNKWALYLYEGIEENTLSRFACWAGILTILTISKLFYHIFQILYWIMSKFFKYVLLPLAIVFSALILSSSKK